MWQIFRKDTEKISTGTYFIETLTDSEGNCIARNKYEDIQTLLPRVKGHPDRMSHEFGMRLYWA